MNSQTKCGTRRWSKIKLSLLAVFVLSLSSFGFATSANAGILVHQTNCGTVAAGGTCYTPNFYASNQHLYSRFDALDGRTGNHCASIYFSGGVFGNACSNSKYAYSGCVYMSGGRNTYGRGSTSSTRPYQLLEFTSLVGASSC